MSIGKLKATSYDHTTFAAADNFIAGKWAPPSGTETMNVVNPRHGKVISTVRFSTQADLDKAVAAATEAQRAWRVVPMRDRAAVLYKTREIMAREIDELSWLLSHENGKLFDEAKAEIAKSIECLEFGCSLPNLAAGENLEVSRGVTCETTHEPLGVVAGIVPFNFPMMVPMWMLPQALVAGNAFILKPSERVPLSTLRLAEISKRQDCLTESSRSCKVARRSSKPFAITLGLKPSDLWARRRSRRPFIRALRQRANARYVLAAQRIT